jgi:hypothetical protein
LSPIRASHPFISFHSFIQPTNRPTNQPINASSTQGGDKAATFLLKLAKLANTKQQQDTGRSSSYLEATTEGLRKAAQLASSSTQSGAESKPLAAILTVTTPSESV